jgi:hypothetical protein
MSGPTTTRGAHHAGSVAGKELIRSVAIPDQTAAPCTNYSLSKAVVPHNAGLKGSLYLLERAGLAVLDRDQHSLRWKRRLDNLLTSSGGAE